ncbi:hypothetical protein A2W13_00730 [Candidatus Woesebacteria bacterium RBG_16_36_11]|uniref:Metallo-beta-lactamase domain-containing protein n=2 Tax=Candidatus Woeseibacteriota TaxID=1752722 RepID=A0A1F7XAW2_9BACT|nr:MAG: hypothetical protein A2W13_00730 [Candidatus Woesebacteria bacterium RBG_16_36_11]OGM16506.1 MAG: hypothetical protein A2V55_02395 [Candidatus Woesebacteria bacterium RBG_19FT_COMBO_37_29]
MITVERLIVGEFKTNCYLLYDSINKDTLIIDPGDDPDYIIDTISRLELKPTAILVTHGHFDHIMGIFTLQKSFKIPFMVHKKDEFLVKDMANRAKYFLKITSDPSPKIDKYLSENMIIKIKDIEIKVMETPGHTPGSVTFEVVKEDLLFVGDLVFKGRSFGRTDFKYSSNKMLLKSFAKILSFSKNTLVYSGHGEATKVKYLIIK